LAQKRQRQKKSLLVMLHVVHVLAYTIGTTLKTGDYANE